MLPSCRESAAKEAESRAEPPGSSASSPHYEQSAASSQPGLRPQPPGEQAPGWGCVPTRQGAGQSLRVRLCIPHSRDAPASSQPRK